jgi:aspartyl/asparaginyl-tRNA synthetase
MDVDDGSGPLQVLADHDIPFQDLASLSTGVTVDVNGVLVPIPGASPESWRLKPRSNADLTLQP